MRTIVTFIFALTQHSQENNSFFATGQVAQWFTNTCLLDFAAFSPAFDYWTFLHLKVRNWTVVFNCLLFLGGFLLSQTIPILLGRADPGPPNRYRYHCSRKLKSTASTEMYIVHYVEYTICTDRIDSNTRVRYLLIEKKTPPVSDFPRTRPYTHPPLLLSIYSREWGKVQYMFIFRR